ncbi:MAG: response regulator, partial [Leptospiraceae bacterium]|nr:response regulator [Leptospiraceae bacterium]
MNLNSHNNEIDGEALRGLRILLVDDEPQMQTVVNRYLESTFGRIEYTDDPATAYQLLDNEYFDILLLDLHFPQANGFQLLADWSTRLRLKHLKIIILSHEQDGHKISEGFGLPITRYIAKEDLPRELLPFLTHLGSEIVPRSRPNRIGWHLLNDLTHHPENIIPYYQLKVNPRRPLAAEALARWKNTEFAEAGSGIVPAGLFFPAIARLPEARQIDFIILEQ